MNHPITTIIILILAVYFDFSAAFWTVNRLSLRSTRHRSFASTNEPLTLSSPCKINLFLRVLGRRPTGYHDLASLFQAVSLSDKLSFQPIEGDRDEMTCSDTTLSIDQSNLVIKALDLMRRRTGVSRFFRVRLTKVVPMQAGLGGGSGNAATAMFAFNELTGRLASEEDLVRWGGEIGSDISFFFSSGTAFCTGKGDVVESLPALPHSKRVTVHLFKPKEGLSTPLVFKTLQLSQCSERRADDLLRVFQEEGVIEAARQQLLINDLEAPAFSLMSKLRELKQDIASLRQSEDTYRIVGEMMSGSGTTVYALSEGDDATWSTTITNKYPDVAYYRCSLLQRTSGGWYE